MTVAIRFAFNQAVIDWLKTSIPKGQRSWNPAKKQWILDDDAYAQFQTQFPGLKHISEVMNNNTDTQEFRLEYIGRPKYTFNQQRVMSYGWKDQKILVGITIEAFQKWFRVGSLYQQLGLPDVVDDAAEIRRAYLRLARQWHPDVCKEPNAQEEFLKIKKTYDILSDPPKKKKYDLGLKLFGKQEKSLIQPGMPIPMRCGILTGKVELLPQRTIVEINSWKDITDGTKVMVSTWKGETYHIDWIEKERRF